MKYYEVLYIVNPNLEQPRLNEIKKEVAAEVTKLLSAEIINHRIFGKKRLAYQIDKHKYGTFLLLHFDAQDNTRLIELNTFFKLNKAIIRQLTVRLDQRPEEDLSPEIGVLNVDERRHKESVAEPAEEPSPETEKVDIPVVEVEEVPDDEAPVVEVEAEEPSPETEKVDIPVVEVEEAPVEEAPAVEAEETTDVKPEVEPVEEKTEDKS